MPRPKNFTLRELFYNSDNPTEIVCTLGICNGRKLSDRAGNLERHLRTMHPVCYEAYIKQKDYPVVKKVDGITHTAKVLCEINKKTIRAAVAELFTKSCIPLRVIEDHAFRMLVKPVFGGLKMSVSIHNVLEQIVAFAKSSKKQLMKEFKGRLLSLKIDAAARQNVSVLGINIQCVNKGCIKQQTLAIKMLDEQQNSEKLIALVLEVLTDYNIGTNQIISITTDNGSYVANDLDVSVEDDKIRQYTDNVLELIGSNFLTPDIANVTCGSHVLYCCVQDVIKTSKCKEGIETWRSIATEYTKLQTNCSIELELDNPSKWYTTYDMFESLLAQKSIIYSASWTGDHNCLPTTDDWDFLEQSVSTFKVMLQAINKLQSQGLCYGDFYIIIMDSIFQLKNLPRSHIQTALVEILNKEKSRLLESDLFVSTVFLDPRIKITLTLGQIVRAKNFIEHLHKRLLSLKENGGCTAKQDLKKLDEPPSTNRVPKTLDELLQTLENKSKNSVPVSYNSTETPIEIDDIMPSSSSQMTETMDEAPPLHNFEIHMLMYDRQQRLPLGENVLKFWSKQNNSLSCIADTLLAIPFSQVNMNRIDAALKYILSEESKTIPFKNLEHILFLKANDLFNYV